jgi:uncharacterized lipoprotein YbaY
MNLLSNLSASLDQLRCAMANRKGVTNPMNGKTLGLLMLALVALAGCAETAVQPQTSCELMTAQVCSRAAEAQLHDGTLKVSYSFRPEEARVVPFVVPLLRPDGVLAAEVDCYADTDSHSYSIVRTDLAIPPSSQVSVDFLQDRHLCADDRSYAEDQYPRVETASARWPFLR